MPGCEQRFGRLEEEVVLVGGSEGERGDRGRKE